MRAAGDDNAFVTRFRGRNLFGQAIGATCISKWCLFALIHVRNSTNLRYMGRRIVVSKGESTHTDMSDWQVPKDDMSIGHRKEAT